MRYRATNCPSCEKTHHGVTVVKLENPVRFGDCPYPYRYICPKTGDEIVLRELEDLDVVPPEQADLGL